jgi:hypothetical protein
MVHGRKLRPLASEILPGWVECRRRKLAVHLDNAPTNNSRMTQNFFGHNSLKKLPHPPDLPDIHPSGLYLFGKVKSALIGRGFPMRSTLLKSSRRF